MCGAAVVVAFFTVSRGKLGTYVLPAMPPLTIIVAPFLRRLAGGGPLDAVERRLVGGGAAALAVACLVAWPVVHALGGRDGGVWRDVTPLAVVGVPLGLALLAAARWRPRALPAAIAGGAVVVFALFYGAAAPRISDVVSDAPLAALVLRHGAPGAPVLALNAQVNSLVFYLRRRVQPVSTDAALRAARERSPVVFVVTSPRHAPVVARAGGFVRWDGTGKHDLWASAPPPAIARAGRDGS